MEGGSCGLGSVWCVGLSGGVLRLCLGGALGLGVVVCSCLLRLDDGLWQQACFVMTASLVELVLLLLSFWHGLSGLDLNE